MTDRSGTTTTYGEVDPLHGAACEAWQLQIGLAAEAGLVAAQARLAAACGLPERPARIPGITHVTLARFRHAARVSVAGALDVTVPVRSLRLVRETIYPTLAFETVARFTL